MDRYYSKRFVGIGCAPSHHVGSIMTKAEKLRAAYPPGTLKVIAPTIFDQTTAAELEDAGAKIIIYTNQPAQAAIRAMTDMLQELGNQDHRIQAVPIFKRWKSISYEELQTAWTKLRQLFPSSIWYPVTSYCSTSWRIAHFAWPSYI